MLPSRDQLLAFIRDNPRRVGKRDIVRAFGIGSDERTAMKRMLKELEEEGVIGKTGKRRYGEKGALPSVAVLEIAAVDTDGEVLARPREWTADTPPPRIFMAPDRLSRAAFAIGEQVLARLSPLEAGTYQARVIRRLPGAPQRALGIFRVIDGHGRIKSIDRRAREDFFVLPGDTLDAEAGELVWAEVRRGRPLGPRTARIVERLGDVHGTRSISLITLHDHGIPSQFSADALAQSAAATAAPTDRREDLRSLPLVTIDGEDARDFDDAVFAEPAALDGGGSGWHLVVAIADVAWYVRPGDPLDRSAFERGNSVYFPDRVVPMLPEALSNGWCSLKPEEDRPCLAAHLWIDGSGRLVRHRFTRATMRSAARLTYRQVQAARDGHPDAVTAPLVDKAIGPLYGAFAALAHDRATRGVLELDLPERRVLLREDTTVEGIVLRERLDSHRLIEEFMIAANVAAAETLEERRQPCLYRVHDQPSREKLEALRSFLDSIGLKLAKGQVIRPAQFNRILEQAATTPFHRLVNDVVLRSQAQAQYDPDNIGHFGLALRRYCHFTSPIRRYADLLIHRALIQGLGLGGGGLPAEPGDFAKIGAHLSMTERRAAAAERDAVDRFTAAFLAEKVGAVFGGRVSGVTRFGLFVSLDETGADGLVPVRTLPEDYYVHDETHHRLVGKTNGLAFRLGDRVTVRLVEADPITGGLQFHLTGDSNATSGARTGADRRTSHPSPRRKPHSRR